MLSHTPFLVLTVFLSIELKEKIMPFADVIDDHRLSSYRACVRQNILILSAASWWCKLYQFNWVIKWALSLYWMQFYYVMSCDLARVTFFFIVFHLLSQDWIARMLWIDLCNISRVFWQLGHMNFLFPWNLGRTAFDIFTMLKQSHANHDPTYSQTPP